MKKITIYIVMAALCLNFSSSAQNTSIKIPPLNTGDEVPEEVWNLPLQVINNSKGKKTTTLSDYRHRLIILDFWATWCSACIKQFPKIVELNKRFKDSVIILPVTADNEKLVFDFSLKNQELRKENISSVVNDKALNVVFPHTMIPHEVWISPKGKVWAITNGTELNASNIANALRADTVALHQKRDVLNFDKDKPLLINGNGANEMYFLKRSIITKYINGVPSFIGYPTKDTSTGTHLRYYATNATILNLFALAFPQLAGFPNNKIILNVATVERYIQPKVINEKWKEQNLFSYELIAPSIDNMTSQFIASELNTFFRVQGVMKNKLVKSFVLKRLNSGVKANKAPDADSQKLSSWVHKHNSLTKSTPLINESGMGNLNVPKDLSMPNAPSTVLFLRSCGIGLIEEVRNHEMFVLTEL